MLNMPALIREWKAVSIGVFLASIGIVLMFSTGWSEELDQVAEISDSTVVLGHHLFVQKLVYKFVYQYTFTTTFPRKLIPAVCLGWPCILRCAACASAKTTVHSTAADRISLQ